MNDTISHPRSDWPRLLLSLSAEQVEQTAARFASQYAVDDLTLPQSGLGLMQMHDGALNERFFIGEVPLSRAHVVLRNNAGERFEGAAQILDDRVQLACAIAVLDAVLAHELPGFEAVIELLKDGAAAVRDIDASRRQMLATTRADFSLLDNPAEAGDA